MSDSMIWLFSLAVVLVVYELAFGTMKFSRQNPAASLMSIGVIVGAIVVVRLGVSHLV